MGEKEKRKEKRSYNSVSGRFKIIASLMGLSLFLGIFTITASFLTPQAISLGWPTSTQNSLRTQNAIRLTLISGSATEAAMTIESAETLASIFLTATALDDWTFRPNSEAQTATAEANRLLDSVQQTPDANWLTAERFYASPTPKP